MSTTKDDLIAKDAAEQLRRWDAGGSIWSIEMGGLGPGYEQAIQVLAIEIVRDHSDVPADGKINGWADDTVDRVNKTCGGFSGAQVGAAKWLAYRWLTEGPAALCAHPEAEERKIQVSKFWPKAEGK